MSQAMQADLFTFTTPAMPTLDVSRCKARIINYETAANMVKTYHYAHRVPSIVLAVGMYVDDVLAGCSTWGTIPSPNAKGICGESHYMEVLELTRLFVFDWAGRNSESWLIGQSFHLLQQAKPDKAVLISYADSAHDHVGYIYQATNWLYTGESKDVAYKAANGALIHRRTVNDPRRKGASDTEFRKTSSAVRFMQPAKHRYVYFLGNRRQRKALRKALRWPVLP